MTTCGGLGALLGWSRGGYSAHVAGHPVALGKPRLAGGSQGVDLTSLVSNERLDLDLLPSSLFTPDRVD